MSDQALVSRLTIASAVTGIVLSLSSCALRTELLSIEDDLAVRGELLKATKLVEAVVPVDPSLGFVFEKIDGPAGAVSQIRGNTIVLDSDELWVRWEDVADFEMRPVVDLQTVAARGIARLSGADATRDGWLLHPDYQVIRRINRFDQQELRNCQSGK